jgi:alkylated DNA repair dioxygenase AlkB
MLSGLLQGYRDLEQRFRGLWEGRRLLVLRTWQLSLADADPVAWPGFTAAKPTWRREAGKVRLFWGDEPWAERTEHSRGRWFAADLKRPEIRRAALELARRFQPACLRQRVLLAGARVPVSGAGTVKVETGQGAHLLIEGTVELELPPQAPIVTGLDEESFRTWLVRDGIAERLPEPPSGEPVLAVADAPMAEVPGLIMVPDFVSELEEKELIAAVDAAPWRDDLKRRVQHYGWRYDYQAKRVDPSARLGPLPDWAWQLGRRLVARGLLPEVPDQVIVNEYEGKQGIAKHVDCLPCFRGPIVTLSLGESWEMLFWGPDGQKVVHMLTRRSAVVLSGPAREQWKHEIPKRLKEPWGHRGRRISLTFRKVAVAREG